MTKPIRSHLPPQRAEAFYARLLHELLDTGMQFLVAGGYAVGAYTGVRRTVKDLDVFTTAGNFIRMLLQLRQFGHTIVVEDERWLGKVSDGDDVVDIIFGSPNGTMSVKEEWFAHARSIEILGVQVPVVGPTELIWSKAFIQNRHRYDGADVINIILTQHDLIDWRRLLSYMDADWEVLLVHVLNFRWVYPGERTCIPRWIMEELLGRLKHQLELPSPRARLCRGRIFSRIDYRDAVQKWGFLDIGNDDEPSNDG